MNQYRDLVAKLEAIQNRVEESAQPVEECSNMPMIADHADQQDSVTMNVSMNGSGAGGIRNLMAILKNIEDQGEPHDHAPDMIVGVEEPDMEEAIDGGFQSATTEPSEETAGIDAVTPTGNDLASKGAEAEKVNGGGNPMQEALVARLSSMYDEIKEGEKKTMSRAAKGHEKFGPKGMKALAKAGREGASEEEMDTIRDKYNKYD